MDWTYFVIAPIWLIAVVFIWRVMRNGGSDGEKNMIANPDPSLAAEIQRLRMELAALKQQGAAPAGQKPGADASGVSPVLDLSSIPDYPKVEPCMLSPLDVSAGWAHLKASVKGYNKSELQDAHSVCFAGNTALLVVCDGAGSKKHSKAGADHCASALVAEFSKLISGGVRLSTDNWKQFAHESFLKAAKSLEGLAESQSHQLTDFGCTGIVVVATDDFVGCAHVGDGRAGYLDGKSCWQSLLVPYKGAEANATVFLSMLKPENAEQYIRTTSHAIRTRSVMALSDGPEGVCWHMSTKDRTGTKIEDPNIPSSNFFTKIANQLIAASGSKVPQPDLDKLWGDFLTAGNEQLAKEPDDKTLLIAVRG
jgi:Protein phosphatase 2C